MASEEDLIPWPDELSSPRSPPRRAFFSQDEPSSPESPKVANPELYAQCISALSAIVDNDPDDHKNMNICFDFDRVFFKYLVYQELEWLVDGKSYLAYKSLRAREMETRPQTTKGPPVMAFICSEGVLIAVDNSVAGTKRYPSVQNNIINISCHVIGCVTGEAADCENICNLLRSLKYPKKKRHSAKKIAMHVAKVLSSENMEGLCEIVFAGWDKTGPSLYCLGGDGKLYEGVMFRCGSCPTFGAFIAVNRDFASMSLDTAAKVVKIGMTMALAESGSESGDSGSDDAGEKNNEIGGSVDVHYVGRYGSGHIPGGVKVY
ncbi:unnamed protein product [Cuscuta campestris]|uniref:Proteasome subunit beta n=1 Tax=Cuscuta campestris TaxID=132261 RepID=A0A484MHA0_9ASTE|nr:unnamed protein product [Cuscuta campestris]